MAGNQVTLEFAGDADKLAKAGKDAEKAIGGVGDAATGASQDMEKTAKSSGNLLDRFSKLGNAVSGAGDAIDQASGLLDDFSQIQNQAYEKSQKQERALVDVRQAQEDYNQAVRDSKQAAIDAGQAQVDKEQADLDAATTLKAYNTAVKEHGKNSAEARQALIDLHQAQVDQKQATEDGQQALRDANQATIDAKSAQLDLNDAQREAHPPDVEKWSQQLQTYTPLLSGLIGVTGLVTAAQWAWNAAQLASPTTLIIVAIVALVAIIVVIATKTKWFQEAWHASWSAIKEGAQKVGSWFKDTLWGDWIKGTWDKIVDKGKSVVNWFKDMPKNFKAGLSSLKDIILSPFRSAFNKVSDAWNSTIGRLSWTVPGWIPGIGGNTISVPRLPHFHNGVSSVPGAPGSEMLAVLQAGETVLPANGSGGGDTQVIQIVIDGDVLLEAIASRTQRRGGSPAVLGLKVA